MYRKKFKNNPLANFPWSLLRAKLEVNTNIMVTVHLFYITLNKQRSFERDKLELVKCHPAGVVFTNAF